MPTPTAILFPGQGSQESGMGRDLAEASREAMDTWKQAERASGLELRAIYWEGEDGAMADTRALQPALTVVNLNLWRVLSGKITPAATAGHSLGEYSSLAAAGVLGVDAVLELVALRGRLMAEADPEGKGTMAAMLKISLADAESAVADVASATGEMIGIANYNTPGQYVASGTKAAIAALQEAVKARKGRALPLPVSGAFHSPLMKEAATEMAKALEKTSWSPAKFAVYPNVTGRATTDQRELKSLLLDQMTSSVRWIDTISSQYADGVRRFVECGPKGVLSKMVKPILDAQPSAPAPESYSVATVGNREQAEAF
ncbi:Malonyl CoA-acyl carrier protein transacylase [uncultured delta proteobacterium]|uniref:Malonyl CoA-acyl carrier protein transacylase n=1 Tax=uncultured delta proteobacterium TaxID=34034 RepID=A0A212KBZ7_9DELT|nr:Malonyl CoA-acyl carrier protein transacylase [uncultured delta proteobacterium]